MHGRLKVKSTEQQRKEKEHAQKKKLEQFKHISDSIFKKIADEEYNMTGMKLTGMILSQNPDYFTMWNYRKQFFTSLEQGSEELIKTCNNELEFIETCLKNNPKSYGTWHQRCFVTELMNEKCDWKHELKLCDLFLQFDGRNFHCWDYRRHVIANMNKDNVDEITFTGRLITENFSNYSSWHYRSKLLSRQGASTKKIFSDELEFVQNAVFTDPDDQSAWFYHRWLIGRRKAPLCVIGLCLTEHHITCTFNRPPSRQQLDSITVVIDNVIHEGRELTLACQHTETYQMQISGAKHVSVTCEGEVTSSDDVTCRKVTLFSPPDADKLKFLEEELESCRELNSLEPDNKWVLLTLALLMRETDDTGVSDIMTSLCHVDPMRSSYYRDMMSKYRIEDRLAECMGDVVDLRGLDLTGLFRIEFMTTVTSLDVSDNALTEINTKFAALASLQVLKLNRNLITSIIGLRHHLRLRHLELVGNLLASTDDVINVLVTCPNLSQVDLRENPTVMELEGNHPLASIVQS